MQNGPLNLLTSATVKKLEFHKSKMADGHKNFEFLKIQDGVGRHLENYKIAISPQRFDRSSRNLTSPTVKN